MVHTGIKPDDSASIPVEQLSTMISGFRSSAELFGVRLGIDGCLFMNVKAAMPRAIYTPNALEGTLGLKKSVPLRAYCSIKSVWFNVINIGNAKKFSQKKCSQKFSQKKCSIKSVLFPQGVFPQER